MRNLHDLTLLFGLLLSRAVYAVDAPDVTDIDAWSLLAPCAATAVSYAIDAQTYSASCSEADLQSCICSDKALRSTVTESISSDVSSGCGGRSASDDQRSASRVFNQYCDPKLKVTFSTPTTNIVNAYITDLPEISYLAPCAQDAVSYAVMQESQSRCPEQVSLFAPCVCSKQYVQRDISQTISLSAKYSCSNNEDVTSGYNFYNAYCAMNDGTTSFEKPSKPKGDMTYHITALSQFSELNSCAQSGLSSAVLEQTTHKCASGPQALASCVCLKFGIQPKISSTVSSLVRYNCDNTRTADVTAALSVFEYYCSAAAGDVVAEVKESISETYPTAESRTGTGSGPSETAAGGDKGGASGGGGGSGGGASKTAIIAASVLGGVIAIALVVGIALYLRRKKRKTQKGDASSNPPPLAGAPELHGYDSRSDIHKAGSPAVSDRHPPHSELGDHGLVEMPNQGYRPELQSHSSGDQYVPNQQPQELGSSESNYLSPSQWSQSPQSRHASPSQATVPPMPPGQHGPSGMGWQSGPMESYEMDSTARRS